MINEEVLTAQKRELAFGKDLHTSGRRITLADAADLHPGSSSDFQLQLTRLKRRLRRTTSKGRRAEIADSNTQHTITPTSIEQHGKKGRLKNPKYKDRRRPRNGRGSHKSKPRQPAKRTDGISEQPTQKPPKPL